MKSRVFRSFSLSALALASFFFGSTVRAQWHPDSSQNTPVCSAPFSQSAPHGCSDSADGAIIVWQDSRSGVNQIYAQHLDNLGRIQWAANGIPLAVVSAAQTNPIITSDGNGGAYVVWSDARLANGSISYGSSIYGQHIMANGALAYPDTGLPVAIGLNGCNNPAICGDGFGKAIVSWEDNRRGASNTDIWCNKLWPNSVKDTLNFFSKTGTVTTVNRGSSRHPNNVTFLFDPNANFPSYLLGLSVVFLPTGESHTITAVKSDTLSLQIYPSTGTYTYYIPKLTGIVVDTNSNKQTQPQMVLGNDSVYLVWLNNQTIPNNSIYGTLLDSSCLAHWDPAPQNGFQFYDNSTASDVVKNVSLNWDNGQLLMAFNFANTSSGHEEVNALRMSDTMNVWNGAVDVTPFTQDDKLMPQIYGDDSVVNGYRGVLVPFMAGGPFGEDDYDISMVRLLGSGGDIQPPNQSYWYYEFDKGHMHNDLQSMKITNPADPTQNGVLAIWDDAWITAKPGDATDTIIYAQRMDRLGRKYFPNMGTQNDWGQEIAGNSPTKAWRACQPCIVPRTDGAIVAWTDYRNGSTNSDIYAQLILSNGQMWIPYDTNPPAIVVDSTSTSDNDSACNAQCTYLHSYEEGQVVGGIDSVVLTASTNMALDISATPPFTRGATNVAFSVCVMDSLKNGTATVRVSDTDGLIDTMNFHYCTIVDTNHPMITVDSLPFGFIVHIADNAPWSRGLISQKVMGGGNMTVDTPKIISGEGSTTDTLMVIDTTKAACFMIRVTTLSGLSASVNPCYVPNSNQGVVTQNPAEPVSLSVYPNPVLGTTTIRLDGAPAAEVTVSDILGHTVDDFLLEGSHSWQSHGLAAGTYIVRAQVGDQAISQRINIQ